MTALIYIGGYGRSGSTLLESLLTRRRDILACGEVVSCLGDRPDRGCTCGKSRQDCAVWGPFYRSPAGPRGTTHTALTLALLDRASGLYGFLVDSSKTAWRALGAPFKLRRALGQRFRLVQIVRDPRAVCWSNAGGTRKRGGVKPRPYLQHLKTALGWWAANLSCEIFGLLYPGEAQRVRYEDLAKAHMDVLERLFAALPEERSTSSGAGGNRHQLYGNQTRYKAFAPADISEDVRWKAQMPRGQQALVAALTWPLRRRYGY